MEEKKTNFKKRASAVTAVVLIVALLLTGTYAYIALDQHDSNEAMGSGIKYDATLNEEYEPPTDWKVTDPAVTKKINVTNTGLTDGTYGNVYVRVQFKEYMEIAPINYIYYDVDTDETPDLYMTKPDGSYVIFDTKAEAEAAYEGHTVAELTDAVSGETGWFVQTQAGDINGQYGKYVIEKFTDGTAKSLVDGVTRATDADYGEEGHNGECDYTKHVWGENVTGYSDTELFKAYVKWTLGDDVIDIEDWDGTVTKKWIIDTNSEDGWVYWADELIPGETTSDLMEAIQLMKQPDGNFYYVIHSDMEAVSYDDLWNDTPGNIKTAWEEARKPKVSGFTVAADGAATQAATNKNFSLRLVQSRDEEQVVTLTGAVTGTNLTNNPGLTAWNKSGDNADWGASTKSKETYKVTIPAKQHGSMTVTATPVDDPSKTITITIEVAEFTLTYSEGNMRYGELEDTNTTTTAMNATINLTSPVEAATERYFTTRQKATTSTGYTIYASDKWALDAGTTGATLVLSGNFDATYKVSFPVGAAGTAKLTVGPITVTFNVGTVTASNSIKVGETFTESGIEWRLLAKENGQALVIAEHILFSQNMHNSSIDWDTKTKWSGSNLRKALNGEDLITSPAGQWYAGLDPTFKNKVVPTTIKTKLGYDGSGGYETLSGQEFFLLSEDEVTGKSNGGDVNNNLFAGTTLFGDDYSKRVVSEEANRWYLRSPYAVDKAAIIQTNNGLGTGVIVVSSIGIRPACVINL